MRNTVLRRRENPSALLVGMCIGAATVENSMGGHRKIENTVELPCDSALHLLGIYPENVKTGAQNDECSPCS